MNIILNPWLKWPTISKQNSILLPELWNFFPSVNNFTLALLVMVVTNITSLKGEMKKKHEISQFSG